MMQEPAIAPFRGQRRGVAYHRPATLDDAVALVTADPQLVVLAGGTDIYPARTLRAGWGDRAHADVLDITGLRGLRGIEDRGDHYRIGALTTWTDIARAALPPQFDGLKAAAREIGGVQIQNRGTIAGNICTASPAGDSIPCLLTLDARVELATAAGVRALPLGEFLTGYRRTLLAQVRGLVTAILVPKQSGQSAFVKLGARRYLVISIVMTAALIELDDSGRISRAAVAVGSCSVRATRLPPLERELVGRYPGDVEIAAHHLEGVAPIDDIRAPADYRRAAALQLVRDVVAQAARPAGRAA